MVNEQNIANQSNSGVESAIKHYTQGNYEDALKLFIDSANKNATSDAYNNIGNCYYKMHLYKEALEYWNRAINLDPKNSRPYANIGNLHYKNNKIELAISYWISALISRPEDAQTNLNMAIAYDKKNMRFEAIKYFEKYVKYEENKSSEDYIKVRSRLQHCFSVANQYLEFGAKFQTENNYKKASACYFKSLANYPNLSKTNLNLGSIFFEDKNLELAIKYWRIASHIEPNYDKVYSNIAISYDLLKQFDYAYCYYYIYMNFIINNKEEYYKVNKRLLKIKPYLNQHSDLVEKHLKLANEYIANNQIEDAIDEFKIYSILKPDEQKKYKDIIKKLESYVNPELSIIASCFEIGNNLIVEARYAEAKPYFWRVMRLSSPQFLEFSKAKAKFYQCEKADAI